ncbi:MAG TPA: hypothetical protein VF482_16310 [Trebonia sp.]
MLENRAAELERRLGTGPRPKYRGRAYIATAPGQAGAPPASAPPGVADYQGPDYAEPGYAEPGYAGGDYGDSGRDDTVTGRHARAYFPPGPGDVDYGGGDVGDYPEPGPDDRTEILINRGRRNVRRSRLALWREHRRAILIGGVAFAAGIAILTAVLPGGGASWPASVATVQAEISTACQNPNVAAEPTQVNFACGKDTRQILWVFALLTSGDNPAFTDAATGRKGLEPISPVQGGDVAWSLNLHHPYDPGNAIDSLQVAARAINNIIGGATLTDSSGTPTVQNGLESSPANCQRYTGSAALVTRQGFPALCAVAVTSPQGQAALVSDVFQKWMVGTPSRIAADAGVLFMNANNPGDPRVQAILNSMANSGL